MTITIPAEDRASAIARLADFLAVCFPGKAVDVEVEAHKAERSSKQNKALFGHAYKVIAAETGLSGRRELEELHEKFCRRFYGERVVKLLGETRILPLRTTTTDENGKRDVVNVGEFAAFYADVERIAGECGIFIPAPDPRWFLDA